MFRVTNIWANAWEQFLWRTYRDCRPAGSWPRQCGCLRGPWVTSRPGGRSRRCWAATTRPRTQFCRLTRPHGRWEGAGGGGDQLRCHEAASWCSAWSVGHNTQMRLVITLTAASSCLVSLVSTQWYVSPQRLSLITSQTEQHSGQVMFVPLVTRWTALLDLWWLLIPGLRSPCLLCLSPSPLLFTQCVCVTAGVPSLLTLHSALTDSCITGTRLGPPLARPDRLQPRLLPKMWVWSGHSLPSAQLHRRDRWSSNARDARYQQNFKDSSKSDL